MQRDGLLTLYPFDKKVCSHSVTKTMSDRVQSSSRAKMFVGQGPGLGVHPMECTRLGYEERRCFFGCSGEGRDNIVHYMGLVSAPFQDAVSGDDRAARG